MGGADLDVPVLGAGMSQLAIAVALERAGIGRFVVVDRSEGIGGTWCDNRHPGAHVDTPTPVCALSCAPNPQWRQRFAAATEIRGDMQRVAERLGVLPHLRLGTRVVAARFDADSGCGDVDGDAGQRWRARCFVAGTGPLSQPRGPDIEALARFAGLRLHSARWDANAIAPGLRAGVVGTGSTAAQLVPPLAAGAARLHVFQRTANWLLPRLDRRCGAVDRAPMRVPGHAALARAGWRHLLEWTRRGFGDYGFG